MNSAGLSIAGMGWITPLGGGLTNVWTRLLAGEKASSESVSSTLDNRPTFETIRVPADATTKAPAHPRLRRSSAISRFAAAAGLAALENAKVQLDALAAERTALIFAVSNGGVVYTKRFYHEVVAQGAQAASPLLFPETVFNAPASHLAAILGITGVSYTLVGDGAVGVLALQMAADLMANPTLDRCLVVGAEETDWLLCDAYHRWRLLRPAAPSTPFARPARGTVLSEGAGAVLLTRGGDESLPRIEAIDAGRNFHRQAEAAAGVEKMFERLEASAVGLVVASANGTFIDEAERAAIDRHCPSVTVYAPKVALGESVGSGAIWQVICAAEALRSGQVPSEGGPQAPSNGRALVSVCGMNQQIAGLTIHRAVRSPW